MHRQAGKARLGHVFSTCQSPHSSERSSCMTLSLALVLGTVGSVAIGRWVILHQESNLLLCRALRCHQPRSLGLNSDRYVSFAELPTGSRGHSTTVETAGRSTGSLTADMWVRRVSSFLLGALETSRNNLGSRWLLGG